MRSHKQIRAVSHSLFVSCAFTTSSGFAPSLKMIPFVDIGANLLDPMFQGIYRDKYLHSPDLVHVLQRAQKAGATRVFVTAGTLEESKRAIRLARDHNNSTGEDDQQQQPFLLKLRATVGIHPTHAGEVDQETLQAELLQICADGMRDGTVCAIGECGLDKLRENFAPFLVQQQVFRAHFEVCAQTGLPMFIHSRDCQEETLAELEANPLLHGGVVHSYDGTLEGALKLCALGDKMFIGINGCSLRTESNLATVRGIPLDRILIETDSPWCEIKATSAARAIVPALSQREYPEVNKPEKLMGHEGKATVKGRNEPSNAMEVLRVIATLKNETVETVARIVLENTQRLFGGSI